MARQNAQTPVNIATKSGFTWWYKPLALVVVFFASTQSGFTNTFVGKAVVTFANCVAYNQHQTLGGCVSNVFSDIFGSSKPSGSQQNAPVTGTAPANLPDRVFDEQGRPQAQYDAQGERVFPDAVLHRDEADYQAKLRAQKLGESQRAYQAGQKQNAHELSLEGKKHGDLMIKANEKAAQSIIKPQKADKFGVLDLHGLYVDEATEAAKSFLLSQQVAKKFREVEIITGVGHHSSGHDPKIRPAIEKLLTGLDLPYHHPPHNKGAFVVGTYSNQDLIDQM